MSAITWIFVPATRTDRITKAFEAGAHEVIVDLEDAIDPADKSQARAQLANFLSLSEKSVWVRVNAVPTEWFAHDMAMLRMYRQQVAGIMLAKTESRSELDKAGLASGRPLPVIALVESARGILGLGDICSHPATARVAFGSADLSSDLGCEDDREVLQHARAQVVLHSSAARLLPPIDGVTFSVDDPDQVQHDAMHAARMGFGAKLCIHPSQLSPTLKGFSPTDRDLLWAKKVIAATAGHAGAIRLDGKMVDKPVIERAKHVLQRQAACLGSSSIMRA